MRGSGHLSVKITNAPRPKLLPAAPQETLRQIPAPSVQVSQSGASMGADPSFSYQAPYLKKTVEKTGWGKWLTGGAWDVAPQSIRDLLSPPKVLNKRTEQEKNDPDHYLAKAERQAWTAAAAPISKRNGRILVTSITHNLIGEGAVRLPQFGASLIQLSTYTNPFDLGWRSVNKIVTGEFSHPFDRIKEDWVDRPTDYAVQSIWSILSGGMPYEAYKNPRTYYNAKIHGGMPDEERRTIETERDAMRLGWWTAVEIRLLMSDPLLKAGNKIANSLSGKPETPLIYVSKFNRVKTYYKFAENTARATLEQKK